MHAPLLFSLLEAIRWSSIQSITNTAEPVNNSFTEAASDLELSFSEMEIKETVWVWE